MPSCSEISEPQFLYLRLVDINNTISVVMFLGINSIMTASCWYVLSPNTVIIIEGNPLLQREQNSLSSVRAGNRAVCGF